MAIFGFKFGGILVSKVTILVSGFPTQGFGFKMGKEAELEFLMFEEQGET